MRIKLCGFVVWAVFLACGLMSCQQEEIIIAAQPEAIGFGTPFIENATRAIDPSYGEDGVALTQFNVWGTVAGNVNTSSPLLIYGGDAVTGSVGAATWSCDNKQYWVPSAEYKFVAITAADKVTVSPTEGLPTSITYNARTSPDADVMVSTAAVTTDAHSTPISGVNDSDVVPFTFQHLLSKMKFTFTTSSAGVFKVSNIAISGLYAEGTYPIGVANPAWKLTLDGNGNPTTLGAVSFGNAINTDPQASVPADIITSTNSVTSNYEHLFLPGSYADSNALTVTFNKDYYLSANDKNPSSSEPVTATIPTLNALPNYAYNIVVNLEGGSQITFHINTMETWGTSTDVNPEEQQ